MFIQADDKLMSVSHTIIEGAPAVVRTFLTAGTFTEYYRTTHVWRSKEWEELDRVLGTYIAPTLQARVTFPDGSEEAVPAMEPPSPFISAPSWTPPPEVTTQPGIEGRPGMWYGDFPPTT